MSELNRTEDRGASGLSPILTHEETAALMGISASLSERTERVAIRKLRRALEEMGLTFNDVKDATNNERGRQYLRASRV